MPQADRCPSTSEGGGFSKLVGFTTIDVVGDLMTSSANCVDRASITVPLSHSLCWASLFEAFPYGSARVRTGPGRPAASLNLRRENVEQGKPA